MRLAGKVALASGGNSGIGEATALRLTRNGARLALVVLNRERGDQLVERIAAQKSEATFFSCEARDEAQVGTMVDVVRQQFGPIDFVFNNAGIISFGSVIDASVQEWDDRMVTNVPSAFLLSHYVPPAILAGGGSVFNLRSKLWTRRTRGFAAYTTSNGATVPLTTAMALDHAGDDVRVNGVCRGTIDTPTVQRQRVGPSDEELRQATIRFSWVLSNLVLNTIMRRQARDPEVAVDYDQVLSAIDSMSEEFTRLSLVGHPLLRADAPYYDELLAHPTYDAFWERLDISRRHYELTVPVLNWDGWYDIFLTDGILRARYRTSMTDPELLSPNEVTSLEIDLVATSNLFLPGHRIRAETASSNFPRFDRNPNTGQLPGASPDLVSATQTIFHTSQFPSRITLPVVPQAE